MSQTCSCGGCALTCAEHAHYPLYEQRDEYWKSPAGITRRIASVAQDFTYKSVNGAIKLYGEETKGVKWLKWETRGDDRVCVLCLAAASKGQSGFFKPSWFMPRMPQHPGDRCVWVVYYDPLLTQTTL